MSHAAAAHGEIGRQVQLALGAAEVVIKARAPGSKFRPCCALATHLVAASTAVPAPVEPPPIMSKSNGFNSEDFRSFSSCWARDGTTSEKLGWNSIGCEPPKDNWGLLAIRYPAPLTAAAPPTARTAGKILVAIMLRHTSYQKSVSATSSIRLSSPMCTSVPLNAASAN